MILLADSDGTDQTARTRRLIWAFAVPEEFSHATVRVMLDFRPCMCFVSKANLYRFYMTSLQLVLCAV